MYCNKCGKQIPDGSAFCSFCGASLSDVTDTAGSGNAGAGYQGGTAQTNQPNGQFQPISVLVNLMTGSGWTAFSAMSMGNLTAGPDGVSYQAKAIGVQRYSHSYNYSDISNTEIKMTHLGVMPQAGYCVTLKDGTKHTYVYSVLLKDKIRSLDTLIRSQMY